MGKNVETLLREVANARPNAAGFTFVSVEVLLAAVAEMATQITVLQQELAELREDFDARGR